MLLELFINLFSAVKTNAAVCGRCRSSFQTASCPSGFLGRKRPSKARGPAGCLFRWYRHQCARHRLTFAPTALSIVSRLLNHNHLRQTSETLTVGVSAHATVRCNRTGTPRNNVAQLVNDKNCHNYNNISHIIPESEVQLRKLGSYCLMITDATPFSTEAKQIQPDVVTFVIDNLRVTGSNFKQLQFLMYITTTL